MPAEFRQIPHFISVRPNDSTFEVQSFIDTPSSKFLWFRLRELSEVPAVGTHGLSGSASEIRSKHRDLSGFLRQARTYWDAADKTDGSASALPYYYAALQLAKAELLQSHPGAVQARSIMHGLRIVRSPNTSVRGDYLEVTNGVFPLLYEKRTGKSLSTGTRLRVINLLSLIPEISLEMRQMKPSRPPSVSGYYALALNPTEAWSVVMTYEDLTADLNEPMNKKFLRAYEEVKISDFKSWREVFALSSRVHGGNAHLYQARRTEAVTMPNGSSLPNQHAAIGQLTGALGDHVRGSDVSQVDFFLTPTLKKSDPLVLPLDLVRYACLFYVSSLVRYSPATLDPASEGAQAYLMDSFTNEVPFRLLTDALGGLTGSRVYFETGGYRA